MTKNSNCSISTRKVNFSKIPWVGIFSILCPCDRVLCCWDDVVFSWCVCCRGFRLRVTSMRWTCWRWRRRRQWKSSVRNARLTSRDGARPELLTPLLTRPTPRPSPPPTPPPPPRPPPTLPLRPPRPTRHPWWPPKNSPRHWCLRRHLTQTPTTFHPDPQ